MNAQTIDHSTLSRLVREGTVREAQVVGQTGGWVVQVQARTLTAQRSKGTRYFKKMDTLVTYLKEVGIVHFQVDAEAFASETVKTYSRPDRATAMKQTHEAAAHDRWFREQVDIGLREADSPDAVWYSQEEAKQIFDDLREDLLRRAAGGKV